MDVQGGQLLLSLMPAYWLKVHKFLRAAFKDSIAHLSKEPKRAVFERNQRKPRFL
jgi:hypothetical protein